MGFGGGCSACSEVIVLALLFMVIWAIAKTGRKGASAISLVLIIALNFIPGIKPGQLLREHGIISDWIDGVFLTVAMAASAALTALACFKTGAFTWCAKKYHLDTTARIPAKKLQIEK